MMRRFDVACSMALAAPLVLSLILLTSVVFGERVGATPFASMTPANAAEAAGMASAVHVIRFIRMGEDPNRVYPVRPEIISSAVLRATTLEAAMWSRQVELVQLLDREGAIVGAAERHALACLAADLQADDIVDYLAPEGVSDCQPGKALDRVAARSRDNGGTR